MPPLADWVKERYPHARRVVEVGVGRRDGTAHAIAAALPDAEVIVTDTDAAALQEIGSGRLTPVRDDVTRPDLDVYRGADLLYAVHPPPELMSALEQVADEVGADLLAVPLSEDAGLFSRWRWVPFVAHGRVLAWLRKPTPVQVSLAPKGG